MSKYKRFSRIEQIENYNSSTALWFSQGAMEFFNSTVYDNLYHGESEDQWNYFITSEHYDHRYPLMYTIRQLQSDGEIETIGKFQQYESFDEAEEALLTMLGLEETE